MIDHFQGYKKLAVRVYTVFINYTQVYILYSTKHYLKVTVQVLLHLHEATPLITVTYLYMLWFNFILGSIFICLCFIIVIIHYCIQKQIKENKRLQVAFTHARVLMGSSVYRPGPEED